MTEWHRNLIHWVLRRIAAHQQRYFEHIPTIEILKERSDWSCHLLKPLSIQVMDHWLNSKKRLGSVILRLAKSVVISPWNHDIAEMFKIGCDELNGYWSNQLSIVDTAPESLSFCKQPHCVDSRFVIFLNIFRKTFFGNFGLERIVTMARVVIRIRTWIWRYALSRNQRFIIIAVARTAGTCWMSWLGCFESFARMNSRHRPATWLHSMMRSTTSGRMAMLLTAISWTLTRDRSGVGGNWDTALRQVRHRLPQSTTWLSQSHVTVMLECSSTVTRGCIIFFQLLFGCLPPACDWKNS